MAIGAAAVTSPDAAEARIIGKAFRRLMGFLFLLYVAAYLDRINIGYAALAMNKDLGLDATGFGAANTFFYATYLCFEVPSNLLLVRFGARRWIARIMITWGIAAAATAFVAGASSLYVVRAFVGLAEAGFVPGMLLYLSYWFPASYRARAMAIFMTAMPATMILGSPLSGAILGLHGFLGVAGWRWLFILEGLPSILLGIACLAFLDDRPAAARWLAADERETLQRRLDREQPRAQAPGASTPWRELLCLPVVLLSLAYFCLVTSLNTFAVWSPQIIRDVLGGAGSLALIGIVGALPALVTLPSMPLWSAHADRRRERFWHTVGPFALAAAGWVLVVVATMPGWRLAGLVLVSVGAFTGMALFWAFATDFLSPAARAVGIGVVSTAGLLASAVSPTIVGVLKDLTHSFAAGLWYSTALLVLGIAALAMARTTRPARPD
jgi:ACS family 4-hydroxyphenylacetate permease-like MFS transporter